MDIATIAGIFTFFGLTVFMIFHSEGVAGFKPFMNLEAVFIVMGGTVCATLVNYPLSQVIGVGKIIKKTLMSHGEDDTSEIVVTLPTPMTCESDSSPRSRRPCRP